MLALSPLTLNHPVNQAANAACFRGASTAAQKYGPPPFPSCTTWSDCSPGFAGKSVNSLVGTAETISAMEAPTNMVKKQTTIHPTDMTPGPPVTNPYSNSVVMPVMTEMIEKDILDTDHYQFARVCVRLRFTWTYAPKRVNDAPIPSELLPVPKLGKPTGVVLIRCHQRHGSRRVGITEIEKCDSRRMRGGPF